MEELSVKQLFLIIGMVFIIMIFGVYFANEESCNQKSISFENYKFGLFSGCMVKHQGKWIPLENIRGFGDE